MAQTLVNVTIRKAESEAQIRREQRYAAGSEGGAIDLSVDRVRDGQAITFTVYWNANRGRGWMKGWKKSGLSADAMGVFVDEKWAQLVAWLEKLEPVPSAGAADAFSTQVASMMRGAYL